MQSSAQISLLFVGLLGLITAVAGDLRCHCTKNSETVKCDEEHKCYTKGYCLMLDHPTHGRHYTCHTRGLNEDCTTRTAKSGVSVDVCGCNDGDDCNIKRWPQLDRNERANMPDQEPQNGGQQQRLAIEMVLGLGLAHLFHRF